MPQPNSAGDAIIIIIVLAFIVVVGMGTAIVSSLMRNNYEGNPKDEEWYKGGRK